MLIARRERQKREREANAEAVRRARQIEADKALAEVDERRETRLQEAQSALEKEREKAKRAVKCKLAHKKWCQSKDVQQRREQEIEWEKKKLEGLLARRLLAEKWRKNEIVLAYGYLGSKKKFYGNANIAKALLEGALSSDDVAFETQAVSQDDEKCSDKTKVANVPVSIRHK